MQRILIMAGGTGGHVMPALAVAECLRGMGHEVVWVGTARGLEARVAREAGFDFVAIRIRGMRRSRFGLGFVVARLAMPFRLAWAMGEMVGVVLRRKPSVLLGMGGFVAGPGGLVAAVMRRPLVIHEQNCVAGLTNRYLARFARRVLSGFPEARGIGKVVWVGNPVRKAILQVAPPQERLQGRGGDAAGAGALRVLVIGGSQGAEVFNRDLPGLLAGLGEGKALDVWQQCGRGDAEAVRARYRAGGVRCRVTRFIEDMAAAYAWSDLVICRAGAMSIAEVCAAGVGAILVPYPHAANGHQQGNAAYMQARGAAHLVSQEEFVRGDWLGVLRGLQARRTGLVKLAKAARKLAPTAAAEAVARACLEVCDA